MGPVEHGVRHDLRKLGIRTPVTTLHKIAIRLAELLDIEKVANYHASEIARELRETMKSILDDSPVPDDEITRITNSRTVRLAEKAASAAKK